MRKTLLSLTLAFATLASSSASAQQSLRDDAEITAGLLSVGMAREIAKKCDGIEARTLRGVAYLYKLRDIALSRGFTSQEIDAYIDSDAEKDRLKQIGRDRLAAMGAPRGDAAAHCAVGRAEIAKGSTIGYFLR